MKYVIKALCIFFAFILQSTLFSNIHIFGVSPDLVLVAVICAALSSRPGESAAYGAFAGALVDIMTADVFGINTLLLMYGAVGAVALSEAMYKNDMRVYMLFAALFTFIYELLRGFVTSVIFRSTMDASTILYVILPRCAINAVLIIPIYLIIKRFRPKKEIRGIRL